MSHNYNQLHDCVNWLHDCGFTSQTLESVVTTIPENFDGHIIVTFTRFDITEGKEISKDYCFTPDYRHYVIFAEYENPVKMWGEYLDKDLWH